MKGIVKCPPDRHEGCVSAGVSFKYVPATKTHTRIGGLVAEYIVAIDVTRVRFPADAEFVCQAHQYQCLVFSASYMGNFHAPLPD